MGKLIAFCGLDCANCEAYIATQAKDEAAKQRVLEAWRKQYNAPSMPLSYIDCDGCTNLEGHPGGHCRECDIRACGIEHGVANCAHCSSYESCEKLARFFGMVPPAKDTLDEIRRAL